MADALCGPSNALQSFKNHSQVDRTLQQDRLAGPRFSPVQGFRSHDPRTGSLDADFHAFENAAPNPFQFQDPLLDQAHHTQLPFHHAQQPQSSGWAADFSQLHISDRPVPVHHFRNEAPLVLSSPGGWQNEFMRHREMNIETTAQGKQIASEQPMTNFNSNNYMTYQMPGQMSSFAPQPNMAMYDEQAIYQQQAMDQGTTEDWSQAFEEAFQSAMVTEQSSTIQDEQMLHQDGTYTNDHSHVPEQVVQGAESIKIGSDAIEYTEMKDRTAEQEMQDSNALARVASELLHNVQHESSEKFQNSQFLELMRKIRDKQVEVKNNDFESTRTETSHQRSINTAEQAHLSTQETIDTSTSQTQDAQDDFQFPDLNAVYEPKVEDVVDYTFETDQFPMESGRPQSQVQDLHPGGRLYPGSPETRYSQMSGGIASLPAEEFEKVDESHVFATRYQKPTVESEPQKTV